MQYPAVPGYGGGMFPINTPPPLPDYMQGIGQALAENQALGAAQPEKPSFGAKLGDFLKAWAGSLGDSLTGNPVYANSLQMRQRAEEEARRAEAEARAEAERRAYQEDWWRRQQEYQAQNRPPPGIANEFDWYNALPAELKPQVDRFLQMKNPGMQAPVVLPWDADPVGGQAGGSPPITATGPNGEKIRFNPTTGQWEPMGGAGGNASGGFRDPLAPL